MGLEAASSCFEYPAEAGAATTAPEPNRRETPSVSTFEEGLFQRRVVGREVGNVRVTQAGRGFLHFLVISLP